MPLGKPDSKSSSDPSAAAEHKSHMSLKKKAVNGDSLRNELQGAIPELSSSNEHENGESSSSETTSSSTPSSDDESGVFDTRFAVLNE
jgi:hypothetical protein